jgi:serine/threonine protein kinase
MSPNFDPNPNDSINLFGRTHVVQPHPRAPHMPYSQLAGRAVVHQLRDEIGGYFALKVFKKQYRDSNLINATQNLKRLESFEGLRAATRRIVMPSDPAARTYRNLEYAMLMSWVHGKTWYDVLGQAQNEGYSLSKPVAIRLCSRFLQIIEGLETAGVAHTDISPGNVSVELVANDVQLLDLEDVYMPGATAPSQQSTGSAGYRHRSGDEGETFWRREGDRYAAAVLAAELLILVNPNLARKATQEGFFRDHSGTSEGRSRFDEAQPWLEEIAPEFAPVFEHSWFASSLEQCSRISELKAPIKELADSIPSEKPVITRISDVRTPPIPGEWGRWEPIDWDTEPRSISTPGSIPTSQRGTRPSPPPSKEARKVVTWSQEPDDKEVDEPDGRSVAKQLLIIGVATVSLLIFFIIIVTALASPY